MAGAVVEGEVAMAVKEAVVDCIVNTEKTGSIVDVHWPSSAHPKEEEAGEERMMNRVEVGAVAETGIAVIAAAVAVGAVGIGVKSNYTPNVGNSDLEGLVYSFEGKEGQNPNFEYTGIAVEVAVGEAGFELVAVAETTVAVGEEGMAGKKP